MTGKSVFLFDVDNTVLDNDRLTADQEITWKLRWVTADSLIVKKFFLHKFKASGR